MKDILIISMGFIGFLLIIGGVGYMETSPPSEFGWVGVLEAIIGLILFSLASFLYKKYP
jgi:hypothetical protein